jgi:hypothetical protein
MQEGEQQEEDAREEDRAAGRHDPKDGEHRAGNQEQGTYLPRRVNLAIASGMRPGADPALGQWPGQSPVKRDGPGGRHMTQQRREDAAAGERRQRAATGPVCR